MPQPRADKPFRVYRAERRAARRRRRLAVIIVAVIVLSAAALVAAAALGFIPLPSRGDDTTAATPQPSDTGAVSPSPTASPSPKPSPLASGLPRKKGDGVKIATFLGNETRRYYGLGPLPARLDLIWRCNIGTGKTSGVGSKKPMTWSGTGWTGQAALVRDKGRLYLLVGGFDHNLHKIDARSGAVVWESPWPDVMKSSPTVFKNPHPKGADDRYIVMCGSRRGYPLGFTDPAVAPYRAVTFGSGSELWRLPAPLTASYSRDCDGSSFYLDGHAYVGVESGWFYDLDPLRTVPWDGYRKPVVRHSCELLGDAATRAAHAGNLVLEASPALLKDRIYISSGAGFVYGMRRSDLKVVWQYRTGSDLDGTAVPTADGKLLVPIEKQYIPGHGGVLMLDPRKAPERSRVWFFPTGDRKLEDWQGGVIGSVAVNDSYNADGRHPALAAFNAIDGNLYVVAQDALTGTRVPGPNNEPGLRTPLQVFSAPIGGGISTPIMVDRGLVTAGYDGVVHLYRISYIKSKKGRTGALRSPDGHWWRAKVTEYSRFAGGGSFESTPICWDGRLYIGSRSGWFYCLGKK